jgi:hypothetical protein
MQNSNRDPSGRSPVRAVTVDGQVLAKVTSVGDCCVVETEVRSSGDVESEQEALRAAPAARRRCLARWPSSAGKGADGGMRIGPSVRKRSVVTLEQNHRPASL